MEYSSGFENLMLKNILEPPKCKDQRLLGVKIWNRYWNRESIDSRPASTLDFLKSTPDPDFDFQKFSTPTPDLTLEILTLLFLILGVGHRLLGVAGPWKN